MQYASSPEGIRVMAQPLRYSRFARDILQGSPRICTCEALLSGKITGIGDGALSRSSSIIIHESIMLNSVMLMKIMDNLFKFMTAYERFMQLMVSIVTYSPNCFYNHPAL